MEGIAAWVANIIEALPVAYSISAGMLAAVNPCGFIMLPTYIALDLGSSHHDAPGIRQGLGSAVAVSIAMAGGFLLLFGALGLVVSLAGARVTSYLPRASLVVGLGVGSAGLAMLAGYRPAAVRFAWLGTGETRTLLHFFAYGIAYGMTSLSCALLVFLGVVAVALAATSTAAMLAQFVYFASGMTLVVLVVSLVVAFGESAALRRVRRIGAIVENFSGMALVAAGAYLVLYWWFQGRQLV